HHTCHDCHHRSCPCSLRLIQQPDKLGTMPSLQHVYEGVLPWSLICSSTSSRAVYLHTADKYHRLTRPTVTRAKKPIREGSHSLPAALSLLVATSTPPVL